MPVRYDKIFLKNKKMFESRGERFAARTKEEAMKYQIMIGILFTLLARRKVSAGELAKKYECSVRSIYRYVEELIIAGIPVDIARGAGGGIYISDAYKLPKGFMTKEEYGRTLDAMQAMLSESSDPVLKSALEKVSAQVKSERKDDSVSGNILVDSGTWGDERKFSEKLSLVERATADCEALEIDYIARTGERTRRVVLPHLLIYKQRIWYLYAFCRLRGEFRTFKIGRMRSIVKTGETFEKLPFEKENIPLSFWRDGENDVDARFEIAPETLPFAEEWLGIENVREEGGKFYADVTLPDDESLIGTILSVGAGLTVLAPEALRERVKAEAEKLLAGYRKS